MRLHCANLFCSAKSQSKVAHLIECRSRLSQTTIPWTSRKEQARELDALQPQLLKPSQPMMPNTSSQMAACLNMTSSSLVSQYQLWDQSYWIPS